MTRRKRRRLTAAVKLCLLIALPLGLAAGARGVSGIRSALVQTSSLSAGKTPSAGASVDYPEKALVRQEVPEEQDILNIFIIC